VASATVSLGTKRRTTSVATNHLAKTSPPRSGKTEKRN